MLIKSVQAVIKCYLAFTTARRPVNYYCYLAEFTRLHVINMTDSNFIETNLQLYKQMRTLLKSGKEQAFVELLKAHPEALDAVSVFGTWLHEAAELGLYEVVEFLLAAGLDVNTKASVLKTGALKNAVENGNCDIIRLLLNAGGEFDLSNGATNPLFVAIENGNDAAAQLLIERGIDITAAYGDPPMCARKLATSRKRTEVLKLLGGPETILPWITTALPDFTGAPMTTEKIAVIEKILDYSFPKCLRRFLVKEFPSRLFHADALDNDEWDFLGADSELFHTVRSYIGYNLKRPWEVADTTPTFEDYIAIGTNGGGDMWCIRKDGSEDLVYIYGHETDEYQSTEKTLAEFAEEWLAPS